jgi:uncharacterized membrane protein YvlD (DUF360 family)
MRFLFKLVIAVLANVAGLLLAAHYIPGFVLDASIKDLLAMAAALMFLNALLYPILKLLLGPLIVITLGIGTLFISAIVLGVLDFLAPGLSIHGIVPLLEGSLILGATNFVLQFIFKV